MTDEQRSHWWEGAAKWSLTCGALYLARFAEELGFADATVGCPPATQRRHALITRYGVQHTDPESLEGGGELVVDILVARGLLSKEHGFGVEWHQAIDRRRQRTEIRISDV